jgi:3-oxoadipate enol-lactonase
MNYQIQGLSIHAEVRGTAEPALVFLHYWSGASRTWRQVTTELEGRFKTVAEGMSWKAPLSDGISLQAATP